MTRLFLSPRYLARIGSLRAMLPMHGQLCLAGTGSAMLTTAVSLHLSGPGNSTPWRCSSCSPPIRWAS